MYYLSEVLSASKQNYPHYQKMCYGVYFTAKKLKPYFQEHPVTVVCTAPLAEIIGSRDASGQVAKWTIELAPYTIFYQPHTAIKSQALANFLVDWAETQYLPPAPDSTHWRMHFDRSKMHTSLGAGIVLTSPKATSSDTHCRSILPPPTMWPSTRRSYTGSGLPKNLAFAGSYVMVTRTW